MWRRNRGRGAVGWQQVEGDQGWVYCIRDESGKVKAGGWAPLIEEAKAAMVDARKRMGRKA